MLIDMNQAISMKRLLAILFALSLAVTPLEALAWGNCSQSKKELKQNTSTEEVKKTEESKKK